jgi:enhancing lycopene biosynthesis protein 2
MMKERIGVILSGCGVYDGSEIQETVLTLFFLARQGVEIRCFAPNVDQHHVINHLTGEEMGPARNVLVESARLVRGQISDLATAQVEELEAVIFPGGFGAAKNLSSFAFEGANAKVHPEVARIIREMRAAEKPMGFLCIAPAVCACVLGDLGVEVTIGRDAETAAAINATGAVHVDRAVEDLHVDTARRIASAPAYMYDATLPEVAAGIERVVKQVVAWARGEA